MTDEEIRAAGWILPHEISLIPDGAIEAGGWIKRTRRQHILRSTPRVGQVFWIDFPSDAYSPEFVNEHPGVVIRAANNMSDTCTVVPITHSPGITNPHAYKLQRNPNPKDTNDAWAICNHIYTIALGRMRRFEKRGFEREIYLSSEDQEEIFKKVQRVLARVFLPPPSVIPPPAQPKPRGPRTLSVKKLP